MSEMRQTQILVTLAPVTVTPDDQATTNDYADIGLVDSWGKTRIVFVITNIDLANSIDWKVMASIDNVTFVELEAEAALAADTTASWVASAAEASYRYFKLQVKSTVPDSHGEARVRGYAKM